MLISLENKRVFYLRYLNFLIWFEFIKELVFEFKLEFWIKSNW
jgi:hypothetical protein